MGRCNDCRCEQEYHYENNTDITADETWQDRIMHIKGVIRVKSGVKLEIKNSRLYFADADFTSQQSGIYIEPGAKVIIDRSLLTTLTCHKNWDGIVVEGNPNLPQWPETNQGVLQITNSTLEKARTGITAMKWFNWGGGIVRVSNTVFKNNNMSFLSGLYQHASASYFNNCVFELTKAHSGCFLAQVVLINNQNIHFRDCTFRNSLGYGNDCYEAANDERIAILAYQSDFYVGPPYGMFPVAPNPNVVSTQSIISGFNKGVDTYGAIEWGARATIWRTRFENNYYGFVANGSNLDQITESIFEDNIYNTFFHYATNYTLAGNTFRNINPNTLIGSDFGYGAVSHQSAGGSRIFANTFNNLYQGVTIEGNNTDLQIKCNNFSNFAASGIGEYRYPWFINDITTGTYEPAALGNQGTGCGPSQTAGNLFYDAGQVHIYAATPVSFWYFANGTPSTTIPNKAGEADLIDVENCTNQQTDPNACPDLPNLNGFEGMTGVGNGSPEDLANDIRNNSVSDNELSVRTTRAVQYYLQQDTTQQQAIEFLTELDTREAKTMLLGAYLQQGDTAMVRHYRLLLNADTSVNPNLKDYYKLLEEVVKNRRSLYDLTGQEAADFEALAESDGLVTTAYIQSLLAMPRLQTYYRVPQPVNEGNKRLNQTSQLKNASWLYPNPAANTINFVNNIQWEKATLYNLHGHPVVTYTYIGQSIPLPLELPNGLYILFLKSAGGDTKSAKLFISK
ncbi:hypothetical protein BVG80_01265 [Sphingobacteriales bacterium TSM_CSM]|nr:hypothetical protein BVG80_01265 [Sphingobacteriales bacterium TSM_CSM]